MNVTQITHTSQSIRLFTFFEAVAFGAAALFAGLVLTWIFPRLTRAIALAAQGFALFGTLVGIFTIALGVGPRTAPDIAYHIGIVIVLVCGLIVAIRARNREAGQH
jgi:hypothetical protein